jgi:tetratricopeptide (TPR) repeat protein
VPVYPPERSPEVRAAVGPGFDDAQAMWTVAAAAAQAETLSFDDAFAYFNLGTSLAGLGDMASAADAFDRARERGLPWRMLWYQHAPFAVYAALNRWVDVGALADANLRNAPNLEESLLWRAAASDVAGRRPQALEDVARAQRLNPLHAPAAAAQAAIDAGGSIGQALVTAGAGLPARALSPNPAEGAGSSGGAVAP